MSARGRSGCAAPCRCARRRAHARRGALLIEMLLAVAIFATAAAFAYAALRDSRAGIDRARRVAIATEIAASRLAELESGALGTSGLRDAGDGIDRLGSEDFRGGSIGVGGAEPEMLPFDGWRVEVDVERSEFEGLSLVTVVVEEVEDAFSGFEGATGTGEASAATRPGGLGEGDGFVDPDPPIRVVLRQLLRLREGADESFESDPLLDGLPEAAP